MLLSSIITVSILKLFKPCLKWIFRFNVKTALQLVNRFLLVPSSSLSGAKYAQGGELFARMKLEDDLSEDSVRGRLILQNSQIAWVIDGYGQALGVMIFNNAHSDKHTRKNFLARVVHFNFKVIEPGHGVWGFKKIVVPARIGLPPQGVNGHIKG